MKNFSAKKILLLALPALLTVSACKEKCLDYPKVTLGKHKVLAEETTGASCPNCPAGTDELTALSQQYGENLVVVSIHGGGGALNLPPSGAKYNFNTAQMEELMAYISEILGQPSVTVDRHFVPGEDYLFALAPWGGYIGQQLATDNGLGIYLTNDYDKATRKLTCEVRIAPEQTLSGNHNLTVYLVQDSIVDAQIKGGTLIPNYTHRHVLRNVLSNIGGNALDEALTADALISRNFTFTLPADYVPEHCEIVAFVHHNGVPDKEVLQVEAKPILE